MKQTIYIDVLISINLFINYFVLLATTKFLNLKVKRFRIILAAFLGSLYSLYILLPSLPFIFSFLIKFVMACSILIVAYGLMPVSLMAKIFGVFYSIHFMLFGILFSLWYFICPPGMLIKNGILYVNISPVFLVIATTVSYVIMRLIQKISGREVIEKLFYDVVIEIDGKSKQFRCKLDTGNTLKEPFSGAPVIVIEYQYIKDILPLEMRDWFYQRAVCPVVSKGIEQRFQSFNYRMIPFRVVSGEGVLPAFQPDRFYLCGQNRKLEQNVFVAICEKGMIQGEYAGIINPEIIK